MMHTASDLIRRILELAANALRRSWFILRHGGVPQFLLFVKEEVARNSFLRMTKSRPVPETEVLVTCTICQWKGRRFMTHMGAGYVVWNAMCPNCGSFPRHRGFAWLLEHELTPRLTELGSGAGYRLLFAPEPSMNELLSPYVSGLEGVDFNQINDLVVYLEDIQNLSFEDDSVDFISCFHVVEHVPDDHKALRELRRVLHPDGRAIINVPITFGRQETIAFGKPNPLLNDHYFDYGEEFSDRVAAAGLIGTGYRLSKLVPPEDYERLALQDELIYWVRAVGKDSPTITDHEGRLLSKNQ